MSDKMIARKRADAAKLRIATLLFAEEVLPELEERLSLYLEEGEHLPDLTQLALLTRRLVDDSLQRLQRADCTHRRAELALNVPRHQRDQAAATLIELLSELRDLSRCLGQHHSGLNLVALDAEVPTDPHVLLRYTGHVLRPLRESRASFPESPIVSFDPAKLVAQLEPAADALHAALKQIETLELDLPASEEAQIRAQAVFERDWGAGAWVLAGLGYLVGDDKPAAMMKLTR